MLEEGAMHVLGTHSHVIGASEALGESRVFYSLGNFLFGPVPRDTKRKLARHQSSAIPIFRWDGERLAYQEWWRSRQVDVCNLELKRARSELPGSAWSRRMLQSPERLQRLAYESAVATRWIWLSLARMAEGVDRPSARKLRTFATTLLRGPRSS